MAEAADRAELCKWQQEAVEAGDLLIWTICERPFDYPDLFTVRPFSMTAQAPCEIVATAATLDGIREMLPPGLTCQGREPGDLPVIVECWV